METTGNCYHLGYVNTFGLAQNDHIKRLLLYLNLIMLLQVVSENKRITMIIFNLRTSSHYQI